MNDLAQVKKGFELNLKSEPTFFGLCTKDFSRARSGSFHTTPRDGTGVHS
jgi:hypothetical protein